MTVQATARRCRADAPDAVDLYALGVPATIVKDDLGEELMIGHGRVAVRLSIAAGTMLAGPVRLDYKLAGRRQLGRRLLALRQWEALMRLRRVPRPLAAPRLDSERAMILIRTLDALANHSSIRAVATALFGADLVACDWNDDSDYLRMKTRRLIGRARRLIAGDYVSLLGRGH
jgi:hypothetical protein